MSDIFKINAHACIQCNPKTGFYETIDATAVVDEIGKHLHIVTVETDEMLQYVNGIYIKGGRKVSIKYSCSQFAELRDWKGRPMYNNK